MTLLNLTLPVFLCHTIHTTFILLIIDLFLQLTNSIQTLCWPASPAAPPNPSLLGKDDDQARIERDEKKRYLLRKLSFRPSVDELKTRKVSNTIKHIYEQGVNCFHFLFRLLSSMTTLRLRPVTSMIEGQTSHGQG